jgi:hypothetical protein
MTNELSHAHSLVPLMTRRFVVNIISEAFIEAANYTSIDAPAGVSEWDLSGLTREPSQTVKPPRVKESAFSMECVLEHYYDMKVRRSLADRSTLSSHVLARARAWRAGRRGQGDGHVPVWARQALPRPRGHPAAQLRHRPGQAAEHEPTGRHLLRTVRHTQCASATCSLPHTTPHDTTVRPRASNSPDLCGRKRASGRRSSASSSTTSHPTVMLPPPPSSKRDTFALDPETEASRSFLLSSGSKRE